MKQNRTIIFVNPGQFGYKAGYYYYCKYLREEGFEIKFLCFDQGQPKVDLNEVDITYIPFNANKIKRTIEWNKAVYNYIRNNQGEATIFFINYFKFCAIFGMLFPKEKKILDIRTGSIKLNPFKNWLQNFFIRQTSKMYKHITILSEGLIDVLKLNKEKCYWLPLGSEVFSIRNKSFENLKLLYVGTLNKRRIHETIEGLSYFLKTKKAKNLIISYDIFGSGSSKDEVKLMKTIKKYNLEEIVHFHGRKNHLELQPYFKECNVGISYVPMTDFFEYQPPTKTFEYILSGMVCVATSTYENRRLITEQNGVLCQDSPKSFSSSIQIIMNSKQKYDSDRIRRSLNEYTWKNVIKNKLEPYLENILDNENTH